MWIVIAVATAVMIVIALLGRTGIPYQEASAERETTTSEAP